LPNFSRNNFAGGSLFYKKVMKPPVLRIFALIAFLLIGVGIVTWFGRGPSVQAERQIEFGGERSDDRAAADVSTSDTGSLADHASGEHNPRNTSSAEGDGDSADQRRVVGPTVWERLGKVEIRATRQQTLADGTVTRSHLLRIQGKYPDVIFEGKVPVGRPDAPDHELTQGIARVANHLLVRPKAGISDEAFRNALLDLGMEVRNQLSPDGAWVVTLPETSLDAADQAIARLQTDSRIAFAEPDYLVFPTDIPALKVPLEMSNGVLIRTDLEYPYYEGLNSFAPVFDPAILAAAAEERLTSYPEGSRILTFDLPTFLIGADYYTPEIREQNFVISGNAGITVGSAISSIYPNNGSNYVTCQTNPATNLTIRHADSLSFTMMAIDLSESTKNAAVPTTIQFTGYKAGGGTVTQSFVTDGINDGTGPLTDFQTFTFNANFTGLSKVVITSNSQMVDNIVVKLDEEETPVPVLEAPLFYQVDFESPRHAVDQVVSVGGAFAPTTIPLGTPTVRSGVGSMDGQALEFTGQGLQQIGFALRQAASVYRLEFDAYLDLPSHFSVHFDGLSMNETHAVQFHADGSIALKQNGQDIILPGSFPLVERFHVTVSANRTANYWEMYVNDVLQFRRTLNSGGNDLQKIRFNTGNPGSRVGYLDNVEIYATPSDLIPVPEGRLSLSTGSITFPPRTVGTTQAAHVLLKNIGTGRLDIINIYSLNSQFNVPGSHGVNIPPGGEYAISVVFAPTVPGPRTSVISIQSNDPQRSIAMIYTNGEALGTPEITFDTPPLDIAMGAGTVGTRSFKLGNSGIADLTWDLAVQVESTVSEDSIGDPLVLNDPSFPSQWSLGAPSPGNGGIDAVHGWLTTTGSAATCIAVIDSGVDIAHPDFAGNLWVNEGEIPGNGLDDDGNGYVDDVHGWDFGDNDSDPTDVDGHGTHVAGIVAARGDNALGVAGVAWNSRVMALKFFSDSGPGYTSDAIQAVTYATRMGAKISNNSWGGGDYSQALLAAIQEANDAGSLFVAAAGNDGLDNDLYGHFPSSYRVPNVVSVASTTRTDTFSSFSNYGLESVDLAAPGSEILSLQPNAEYALSSGTSMAAPHVAGVAALLQTENPTLTPSQLKQLLMYGSDSLVSLSNRVASYGRLNAAKALRAELPRWLQPEEIGGIIPPDESRQIPLTIDTSTLALGTYTQSIIISSNDPRAPRLNLDVILRVVPNDDYTVWLRENFAVNNMLFMDTQSTEWADGADMDGDGVTNFLEYFSGQSPTSPNTTPVTSMVPMAGEKVFEFRARQNDPNVEYVVEWSETLQGTWRRDGLEVVEDSTEGMPPGVHRIRVKLTGEQPASAFFRLVVGRSS
jgi:hypothetical protein